MVIGLILGMALASASGCTKGSEYEPPLCPAHLSTIAALTVERIGARAYLETDGQPPCTRFRPSRAQIVHFLTNARTTDAQSADATLDRSPCYASGTAHFTNGSTGRWRIEQLGVGMLDLPGRETMLLYCKSCRVTPFIK